MSKSKGRRLAEWLRNLDSNSKASSATLADDSITAAKLQTDAVTNPKIADGAVHTANLADANVTFAKLHTDVTITSSTGISGSNDNDTTVPTTAALIDYIGAQIQTKDNSDEITEGSTNLYFTNERVDDRVNSLLTAGTGITLTYDDTANTLTVAGAAQYGDSDVASYLSTNGYGTSSSIIASITDSAPTTLDTLNELAAALGDDANFSTTVTNSIGTKWTQDNTKISNWDTAYGWGNHASAGYLTSYTEADTLNSVTGRGATTTNAVGTGKITVTTSQQNGLELDGSHSNGSYLYINGPVGNTWFGQNGSGLASIWSDGSTQALTLAASTGNATFSGSVAATGATFTGDVSISTTSAIPLVLKDSNATGNSAAIYINYYDQTNAVVGYVGMGSSGNGDNYLYSTNGSPHLYSGNSSAPKYNNNTIWHAGNDGSGSGLDADTLDGQQLQALQQTYARIQGWNPGYSNSDEASVYYDFSERAVAIHSTTDQSIGATYKAIPVTAGERLKFNVQVKGDTASSDGLYARIYYYTGNLPAGKTHVSNSATHTLVQEDTGGDSNWNENGAITTSYVSLTREWIAPSTGYVSLVILNWSGHGTNKLFVKDASIDRIQTLQQTDQNIVLRSGSTNASALLLEDANDAFRVQLYGAGGDYGFLASEWGGWDIRKTPSGNMSLNNSTSNIVWHAGNDGSGSGLDADTLDGQQGSYYTSLANATGQFTTISATNASSRDKIRVYPSGNYAIGMQDNITYGHLNDWAMTFQMNDDTQSDRGFWWGDTGHGLGNGAMSLTTNGRATIATSLSIGQGESITGPDSTTLYVGGNAYINGATNGGLSIGETPTNYEGWDTQLNVNGSGHSRINVKTANVRMGIYAHDSWQGGAMGHVGTYTNHQLSFICNATQRAVLTTAGSLSTDVQGTLWGASNDGSGSGLDADTLDGIHKSGMWANMDGAVRTNYTLKFRAATNSYAGIQFDSQANTSNYAGFFLHYGGSTTSDVYTADGITLVADRGWLTLAQRTTSSKGVRIMSGTTSTERLKVTTAGDIQFVNGNSFTYGGNAIWHAGNDGSGSGLDADTVDGANTTQSGGAGSIAVFNAANGYLYTNNWVYLGTGQTGIYSGLNGAHWYPNAGSTYGNWRMSGSRNGYGGFWCSYSAVNTAMHDSAGNGGTYRQANGRWYWYHHVGNNCTGFSGSTTSSAYSIYSTGAIYSTGNITAYSDRRVKENIIQIDSALDKVNKLEGVYYNKIDDETKTKEIGFIAQDVQEVVPELVTYAEDVDEYGVKYGNATALLVEAIKELTQQVNTLKKELEELKNA